MDHRWRLTPNNGNNHLHIKAEVAQGQLPVFHMPLASSLPMRIRMILRASIRFLGVTAVCKFITSTQRRSLLYQVVNLPSQHLVHTMGVLRFQASRWHTLAISIRCLLRIWEVDTAWFDKHPAALRQAIRRVITCLACLTPSQGLPPHILTTTLQHSLLCRTL